MAEWYGRYDSLYDSDMIASYRLYDMSHSVIYTVYMKVPTVFRNSKNWKIIASQLASPLLSDSAYAVTTGHSLLILIEVLNIPFLFSWKVFWATFPKSEIVEPLSAMISFLKTSVFNKYKVVLMRLLTTFQND